jgi:hypothetical protein
LPFDSAAAAEFAAIAALRPAKGRPIAQFDVQMAALLARAAHQLRRATFRTSPIMKYR